MSSEYGRVMPSAIDLEELVLGAILIEKDALSDVITILNENSFYKEENAIIFKAILTLNTKSAPIDLSSVTKELLRTKSLDMAGGPGYLVQLTNRIASSENIEYHARIIKQQQIRRELIYKAQSMMNGAYNDSIDVFDILADTEKSLGDITGTLSSKQIQHISDIVGVLSEERKQAKNELQSGVTSGLIKVDDITGGWNKSDLIILAARPGMGKTSLMLSFIRNAAKTNTPCAVFSIEMNEKQIVNRTISQEAAISATRMRKNQLSDNEKNKLEEAGLLLSKLEIYIDDTPSLSLLEFKTKARRLKRKHDIGLIVVDYLQLMNDGNKSRSQEQEVSNISKGLKAVAKELDVPIIALSQLSRDVERRNKSNNRPVLSDLRGSGSIEQDADIVMFIYRPDYYDRNATDESGESLKGIAEIIVAKNRHGGTDVAKVKFEEWSTRFINREEDEQAIIINSEDDTMPF